MQALMYVQITLTIAPPGGSTQGEGSTALPLAGLAVVDVVAGVAGVAGGLVLSATAAFGARWSAARLHRVSEERLAWTLRALTLVLAIDCSRRAIGLALVG
jgi:hypothetical protein